MHSIRVAAPPNYWETIHSLAQIFEDLHLSYALAGLLASSPYGLQRATGARLERGGDTCKRRAMLRKRAQ